VKQAVVEVNFRPKIGIPALAEKYLEQFVKSVAETVIIRSLHPRTLFSIIVQVMQDQGSVSFDIMYNIYSHQLYLLDFNHV